MDLRKVSLWILSAMIFITFHPNFSGTATYDSSTTDVELQTLSELLLSSDINNVANSVSVNPQGRVKQGNKQDSAPYRLLTVNPRAWVSPTIARLRQLFDNYEPDVRYPEEITAVEHDEENDFLDAMLGTPIMKTTHEFLADKGYCSYDVQSFKDLLYDIWFRMYPRGKGEPNSSGFEHVFVGELKGGEVGGFHNWVRFYNQEEDQSVNYLGYIQDKSLGSKRRFIKITFKWKRNFKAIGSIFVGTSPEFEIALYTVCFLTRPNGICRTKLAGVPVSIQTHTREYNGKVYVATAYPSD